MNRAAEALYLLMLNSGKLDTAETEQAFYSAYDYILGIAECEENGEERARYLTCLPMWKTRQEGQPFSWACTQR